jgi:hypothetical protein
LTGNTDGGFERVRRKREKALFLPLYNDGATGRDLNMTFVVFSYTDVTNGTV